MFAFTPFAAPQYVHHHAFSPYHDLAAGSCYNHDSMGFSRRVHHPGLVANCRPRFDDVFLGNLSTAFPVHESQYSRHPSQFHDMLASLQALEREEAHTRILVDRQRRVEYARAQALAREREEYLRQARARQQAEELSRLINLLSSFVEQASSEPLVGVCTFLISFNTLSSLTRPSLQSSNRASSSEPSMGVLPSKETNTPNEALFHTPIEVILPSSTLSTSSVCDRKGKARETPAIPLPRLSKPAPGSKLPTTSAFSLLRERQATETDPDVKHVLDSLLNVISGSSYLESERQTQETLSTQNVCEFHFFIFDPILTSTLHLDCGISNWSA